MHIYYTNLAPKPIADLFLKGMTIYVSIQPGPDCTHRTILVYMGTSLNT